ncbi:hypothetical protein [Pelosinus propionicus]|nr:hypothetical protein [Pelosinus propionicus]
MPNKSETPGEKNMIAMAVIPCCTLIGEPIELSDEQHIFSSW